MNDPTPISQLSHDYDPAELVSRFLKNEFDVNQIVMLHQITWDYYDWLLQNGSTAKGLMKTCRTRQPVWDLSFAMSRMLWIICYNRSEQGLPNPDWIVPPTPESEDDLRF